MGTNRSILFIIPFGLLGVLGAAWQRRSPWVVSIGLGTLLSVLGFFFGFAAVNFVDQDVWVYLITQVTELAEWYF